MMMAEKGAVPVRVGAASRPPTSCFWAQRSPWVPHSWSGQFMLAGWRHGWHGGGHGRFAEHVCGDARDEILEDRLAFVDSFVDFTDEQEPAWQQLTAAIRAGSAKVGEVCAELEAPDPTAPAHLARVELILSTGLDIVEGVRPAFEQFYAVLDDDQKAALDKLVSRHHQH
jgi:LTXXQ motif family protein